MLLRPNYALERSVTDLSERAAGARTTVAPAWGGGVGGVEGGVPGVRGHLSLLRPASRTVRGPVNADVRRHNIALRRR